MIKKLILISGLALCCVGLPGTLEDSASLQCLAKCGNGVCTLRQDKKGRSYCTCKGRKGRAKLSCCN